MLFSFIATFFNFISINVNPTLSNVISTYQYQATFSNANVISTDVIATFFHFISNNVNPFLSNVISTFQCHCHSL